MTSRNQHDREPIEEARRSVPSREASTDQAQRESSDRVRALGDATHPRVRTSAALAESNFRRRLEPTSAPRHKRLLAPVLLFQEDKCW